MSDPKDKPGIVYETDEPVSYRVDETGIAWITMNRPKYNNAQNSQMTYALDAAFVRAVNDDAVKVIVLAGEGKHFSAGHDIGTPGRDVDKSFDRKMLLPDHVGRPGAEFLYTREQEVYLVSSLARCAQGHGCNGTGRLYCWRSNAGLGLRSDCCLGRCLLSRPGGQNGYTRC